MGFIKKIVFLFFAGVLLLFTLPAMLTGGCFLFAH